MLAAFHANPREGARQRQNPGRQANAANRPGGPRSIPRRECHRLGREQVAARRSVDKRAKLRKIARCGERPFVEARLEGILDRDHQLHALQRAEAELFEGGLRREFPPPGVFSDERGKHVGARPHEARRSAFRRLVVPLKSRQLGRLILVSHVRLQMPERRRHHRRAEPEDQLRRSIDGLRRRPRRTGKPL